MLEVNQEALVNRCSVIVKHAHLAKLRIWAICLDVSAGTLWRTHVVVQQRRILFRSLHPNVGHVKHIIRELFGTVKFHVCK